MHATRVDDILISARLYDACMQCVHNHIGGKCAICSYVIITSDVTARCIYATRGYDIIISEVTYDACMQYVYMKQLH